MTRGAAGPPPEAYGFAAYRRATIVQFFSTAAQERARLLSEIATARRRIADAQVAMGRAAPGGAPFVPPPTATDVA